VDRTFTVFDALEDPVALVELTAAFGFTALVVLEPDRDTVEPFALVGGVDAGFFDCAAKAPALKKTAELMMTIIRNRRLRFIPPSGDLKTIHSLARRQPRTTPLFCCIGRG
jgi:hypothetical protein